VEYEFKQWKTGIGFGFTDEVTAGTAVVGHQIHLGLSEGEPDDRFRLIFSSPREARWLIDVIEEGIARVENPERFLGNGPPV
jgi:hypothetical protein